MGHVLPVPPAPGGICGLTDVWLAEVYLAAAAEKKPDGSPKRALVVSARLLRFVGDLVYLVLLEGPNLNALTNNAVSLYARGILRHRVT
jgi:hypothetical protein